MECVSSKTLDRMEEDLRNLRQLRDAVIEARPALERAADELDLLTAEEFAALRSVLEMLEAEP